MRTTLARVRRVLAMDANEAMDRPIERYVDLFRKHPAPMHVLGVATTVGVLAAVWLVAGPRVALFALAVFVFLPVALAAGYLLRGRQHAGTR